MHAGVFRLGMQSPRFSRQNHACIRGVIFTISLHFISFHFLGVNEVYLLHGSKGNKDDICHEGLDQRLSRIGHFGRGIYFSNDVRKCFSYTKKEESNDNDASMEQRKCTIYKCRVLLGIVKVCL